MMSFTIDTKKNIQKLFIFLKYEKMVFYFNIIFNFIINALVLYSKKVSCIYKGTKKKTMKIFIEHIKFNIQCITCILLSKKMIKHCFHFVTYNMYSSQQLKGLINRLIDWGS